MLLVAVVDQGVEAFDGLDPDVAAVAAVAAVGPAVLDELLAPERDGEPAPPSPRADIDLAWSRNFIAVDRVFATQKEMYDDGTVGGVHRILKREAATLGIDEAKYAACISDEAAFEALKVRLNRAETDDKIAGTPTFDVNGVRVEPPLGKEMDLATLDAAIASAKKGK
jgi:hypothetical protein